MAARANVVLPAPRSPDSATRSPRRRSSASRCGERVQGRPRRASGRNVCFHVRDRATRAPPSSAAGKCGVSRLACVGGGCSGKRTVTRVPRPGSNSSRMSPLCNSTRLLTIDRPRPGAAMLAALAAALEALEHARLLLLGDADAVVLDRERDHALLAPHRQPHEAADIGEADRVRQQIVEHLPHARLVGEELDVVLGGGDVDRQALRAWRARARPGSPRR